MSNNPDKTGIVRVVCKDQPGLMYKVTRLLYREGCNVIENDEYVDKLHSLFFMRTAFEGDCDPNEIERAILESLPEDAMVECFQQRPKRIVILATKEAHCLGDLLVGCMFGDVYADIATVISNHSTLRDLTERLGYPFHCISHESMTRDQHEHKLLQRINENQPDYIVMAKYMRILSADMIARYRHRIINIHHSFLPAFVGANPYRQAYDRGVKIIGATAHFASKELDEGPIIAQSTTQVDHSQSVKSMIRNGRYIEKSVLAKALRLVFEDRVFVQGNRTIVFE